MTTRWVGSEAAALSKRRCLSDEGRGSAAPPLLLVKSISTLVAVVDDVVVVEVVEGLEG